MAIYDWQNPTPVNPEPEFMDIPEGTYPFIITDVKLSHYQGASTKIDENCPYFIVEMQITTDDGQKAKVTDRFYMMENMMWKGAQLFKAIGAPADANGHVTPRWDQYNMLTGKEGYLEISKRDYTKNDGTKATATNVKKYMKPDEVKPKTQENWF